MYNHYLVQLGFASLVFSSFVSVDCLGFARTSKALEKKNFQNLRKIVLRAAGRDFVFQYFI
jgi:hypothetical protein